MVEAKLEVLVQATSLSTRPKTKRKTIIYKRKDDPELL